jgi:hypothetical protein
VLLPFAFAFAFAFAKAKVPKGLAKEAKDKQKVKKT